ncbi:MAG: lasso peptide biosynthesis B2 protein [Sphingomonas sp.]|jgi:hypothetical protein
MEQPYQIREGVGFSRFEGRTIILDIAADRYWQLGEDAGLVLEAIRSGSTRVADEPALARLVTLGFIAPVGDRPARRSPDAARSTSCRMPAPADSALERTVVTERPGWATACEVVALAIIARIALRTCPLKMTLDRLAFRRERAASCAPASSLEALARQFGQLRRLLPLRPLCLPDSIAFLRFAIRRGHAPRLVFGVEAFPFTAHCWVQDGSVVLTDALDHASRFKPILVI